MSERSIEDNLEQLSDDKEVLVANLQTKGVEDASSNDPMSKLVNDVLRISGGGVGQTTEDGGEIFNDYTTPNAARSINSHAEGGDSQAGTYAFKILSVVDRSMSPSVPLPYYELDSVEGLAIGDVLSVKWGSSYINKYTINGTTIAINSTDRRIEFTEEDILVQSYDPAEATEGRIFVISKPHIGTISFDHSQHAEGYKTKALLRASHAEGGSTVAADRYSHAEGKSTFAVYAAHAEGDSTKALGEESHAEGQLTEARGHISHAEGGAVIASGECAHAEGSRDRDPSNISYYGAHGSSSHVEGFNTNTAAFTAHAEGQSTFSGLSGFAIPVGSYGYHSVENTFYVNFTSQTVYEGLNRLGIGKSISILHKGQIYRNIFATYTAAHRISPEGVVPPVFQADFTGTTVPSFDFDLFVFVEGHPEVTDGAAVRGISAHSEGTNTVAVGDAAHAEGQESQAIASRSHAEGYATRIGENGEAGHAEGYQSQSNAWAAHAEGNQTQANGLGAHSEGEGTRADGTSAHAEGEKSTALGFAAHAEGQESVASGYYSHAEGEKSTALGFAAHAEGHSYASGNYSHAEGESSGSLGQGALGDYSHAEGQRCGARSRWSHVGGLDSLAVEAEGQGEHLNGRGAFVHGESCTAYGKNSAAFGKNNYTSGEGTFVAGIGNGTPWGTDGSAAFGLYCDPNETNALFIVGNGSDADHTSNAFVVLKDGSFKLPNFTDTSLSTKVSSKPYVRLAYVNGTLTMLN